MRVTAPELDEAARNALVLEHVGLVKVLARQLSRRLPDQIEMTELISAGVLGLVEAAGRYRPSTGVPFEAYARRRLRGAMLDALREVDWAPRSLRRSQRALESSIARLRHELGAEPSEEAIAAALGVSVGECRRMLDDARQLEIGVVKQLDSTTVDGAPLLDLCVDPGEGPERRLARQELRMHLAAALGELPERERHILAMYYEEDLTLAEIGDVLGVSESRVSQLRSLAISRLRARLRSLLTLPEAV